jgi:hypothetical protein
MCCTIMVKFLASRTFNLESMKMFFLCGSILSGEIKKGMAVKIWVDSELFWIKPVEAIEFVDGPEKESEMALGLSYSDTEELEWLSGLSPTGEAIEIVENHDSKGKINT